MGRCAVAHRGRDRCALSREGLIQSRLPYVLAVLFLGGSIGCWQPGQTRDPIAALSPDAGLSRAKPGAKRKLAFDDGGNRQGSAAFIERLDADGHPIWSVVTSGPGSVFVHALAVDSSGNTVMMGTFNGHVRFGRHALRSTGIFGDYFLAKISNLGRPLWGRALLPADMEAPSGLAIGSAGEIFITGAFSGKRKLGGQTLDAAGGRDIFVAAFAADGQMRNAVRVGGPGDDIGHDIALSRNGDLFLTGSFSGPSLAIGGQTLEGDGTTNMFIVRLAPTGHVLWARASKGCEQSEGYRLVVDAYGDVVLLGHFWSAEINVGPFRLEALSRRKLTKDIFVTKLSSTGDFRWAHVLGGSASDEGLGLTLDATGAVSVLGRFEAPSAVFGSIIIHAPSLDGTLFVATLNRKGVFTAARALAGSFEQAKPRGGIAAEARFVTGDINSSAAHGVDLPPVTLWTASLTANPPTPR